MSQKELSLNEDEILLNTLRDRFEKNMNRHNSLNWEDIQIKLQWNKEKLRSLSEMEKTGGEPDVIEYDASKNEYIFCDCSQESPIGRRSLCYDQNSLDSRKENKPRDSAQKMADMMGIKILTIEQYQQLQKLWNFDTKTSSWLETPLQVRKLGWALYGDRRYNTVFIYHNWAESYYAARGFRWLLKV